jgi:hypothetical protein
VAGDHLEVLVAVEQRGAGPDGDDGKQAAGEL